MLGGRVVQVRMGFHGLIGGQAAVILPMNLAQEMTAWALEQTVVGADEVMAMTEELGNVTLNALLGSLANLVGTELHFDVPVLEVSPSKSPLFQGDEPHVYARARSELLGDGLQLPGQLIFLVRCQLAPVFVDALEAVFMDDNPAEHFLLPGDLVIREGPAIWTTVLGSCVSVCIRHRHAIWAGMNHYLLASGEGEGQELGRYGNLSIQTMWNRLRQRDDNPDNYRARIFGGAKMFDLQAFDIGARNIEVARDMLHQLRIPIVESQVGGGSGVRLRFETEADRVQCDRHAVA